MTQPDNGPQPDFALDPESLQKGVRDFLAPIVKKLAEISPGFTAAHAEVATAHDTEAAGWFGGEGDGDVRSASSSFFNQMEYHLRWLAADYAELAQSLADYETFLLEYAAGVRVTDNENAQRFHGIMSQLDEEGR
jgi:hypothetical protein